MDVKKKKKKSPVVAPRRGLTSLSCGSCLLWRAERRPPELPPLHPTTTPAGIEFAVELHAGSAIAPLIRPGRPTLPAAVPRGRSPCFTSGTTGEPRPSASRARTSRRARAPRPRCSGSSPDDRWLCCLPVFHVGGLSIFTRSALYGTTVVAERLRRRARAGTLLESGEVTLASLVPTMLARLRDAGLERAPKLRAVLLGGGPIPDELLAWALDVGLPVHADLRHDRDDLADRDRRRGRAAGAPASGRRSGSATTARSSCAGPWSPPTAGCTPATAAPDRGRPARGARQTRRPDRHWWGERRRRRGGGRPARAPRRDGRRRDRRRRSGMGEGGHGVRRRDRDRGRHRRARARDCPASRCRSASTCSTSCRARRPGRSSAPS